MEETAIKEITRKVGEAFPSFGGGRKSIFNPPVNWLTDKPLQFALGVDIESVVRFIVNEEEQGEVVRINHGKL